MTKPEVQQKTQYVGNNTKSLHVSVEASLKKLRTSYIDILYVHWVCRHVLHLALYPTNWIFLDSGTGPVASRKS